MCRSISDSGTTVSASQSATRDHPSDFSSKMSNDIAACTVENEFRLFIFLSHHDHMHKHILRRFQKQTITKHLISPLLPQTHFQASLSAYPWYTRQVFVRRPCTGTFIAYRRSWPPCPSRRPKRNVHSRHSGGVNRALNLQHRKSAC